MARSKPPRRYPSYRSAHYVSRTPCRPRLSQKGLRARSTDESIKDERGISQYREREARGGGDESNENGTNGINKTKEQTAGYIRDTRSSFKAFHLLVTNGWLLGANFAAPSGRVHVNAIYCADSESRGSSFVPT